MAKIWRESPFIGKASLLFRLLSYVFSGILIIVHRQDKHDELFTIDYITLVVFIVLPFALFAHYKNRNKNRRIALDHNMFDFFSTGWLIALLNFAIAPGIIFFVLVTVNQISAQGFRKLYRMFLLLMGATIPLLFSYEIAPFDYSDRVVFLCYGYAMIHVVILSYASYIYARELKYKSRKVIEQHEKIRMQSEELSALNDALVTLNHNLEQTVEERTSELKVKNKQLAEYAFINGHKLRAPISTLQGLLHLMGKDQDNKELILKKIKESIEILVLVVTDIRIKLEQEEGLIDPEFEDY